MNSKLYKNPRFILFIIFLVTIYGAIISFPRISINSELSIPYAERIPFLNDLLNENKKIKIETEIGGYEISWFNGGFIRDGELKRGLDIAGGVSVLMEADMSAVSEENRTAALDSLVSVIEERVNLLGLSESLIQSSKQGDKYRIIVELAGIQDPAKAIEAIGQTAMLEFRELKDIEVPVEGSETPQTIQDFVTTELSGSDLKRAAVVFNQSGGIATNSPEIQIQFSTDGAIKFKEITQRNINKPLAIYLDERMLMAPVVQTTISNGVAVITGQFTPEDAKTIVAQLNAGALPTPVTIIEQKTVGPSLGQESVNKSVIAGLIGLSMVIVFMIAYYGWLGFFASLALVVYAIFTLSLYKLIPVVLTLPGLTGFIISIGMAVDANILIFERIKEELRGGKPLSIAMENGFGRSWDSIRDANTATLMTAFVLFNPFNWSFLPVSGMVRGFALTLALGIFISLFTGVFITRNLVRVFYNKK